MRHGVVYSISLSVDLADFVDDYIAATGMKRSHVIATALRLLEKESPDGVFTDLPQRPGDDRPVHPRAGLSGAGHDRHRQNGCAPSDVYDPAVGERIAFGRALAELGAQIEAQGLAEVKPYADFVKDIARNYVDNVNAEPVEETPPTWDPADNPEQSIQEEAPDESAEPHVPEGIEKWVREHGYRLEVSAER